MNNCHAWWIAIIGWIGCSIAFVIAWMRWEASQKVHRAQFLAKLMQDFEDDKIRQLICSCDSSGGASDYFKDVDDLNKRNAIENSIRLLSYLCYLQNEKLITKKEFEFFKDQLDVVLSDEDVIRYIQVNLECKDESGCYSLLIKYAKENDLYSEVVCKSGLVEGMSDCPKKVCDSTPICINEFEQPTVIIRINKRYCDGMDQKEILEVARKWWRISPEKASQIKLALAVYNGVVKGVFRVSGWEKDISGDYNGRYEMIGDIADKKTSDRFMKRSVKGFFPKGATNPIRYFGI